MVEILFPTMAKIVLKKDELGFLNNFISKGKRDVRELNRARALMYANEGKTEEEIKEILGICRATVSNIKRRYRDGGLEKAIYDEPRPGQPKKYDMNDEAEIIALACTEPPKGNERWTGRLLTKTLKKKKGFETVNRESIRLILKKTTQNHG